MPTDELIVHTCIAPGCSTTIPHGTGCACAEHHDTGEELLASFGSGIPGDGHTDNE